MIPAASKPLTEKQMLRIIQGINDIVQTDFFADMNTRLIHDDAEYTQEEAREMLSLIGSIYTLAHQFTCEACRNREK